MEINLKQIGADYYSECIVFGYIRNMMKHSTTSDPTLISHLSLSFYYVPFIKPPKIFTVRGTWTFDIVTGQEGVRGKHQYKRIDQSRSCIDGKHKILKDHDFEDMCDYIMKEKYGTFWKNNIKENGEKLAFKRDELKNVTIISYVKYSDFEGFVLWKITDVDNSHNWRDHNYKLHIKSAVVS
eukprot:431986_1